MKLRSGHQSIIKEPIQISRIRVKSSSSTGSNTSNCTSISQPSMANMHGDDAASVTATVNLSGINMVTDGDKLPEGALFLDKNATLEIFKNMAATAVNSDRISEKHFNVFQSSLEYNKEMLKLQQERDERDETRRQQNFLNRFPSNITFSGKPEEDVTDFIKAVNRFQKQYGIDNTEVVRVVTSALRGSAQLWFEGLNDVTKNSWMALPDLLIEQYGPLTKKDIRFQLYHMELKKDQSIREFGEELIKKFKLCGHTSDIDQVQIFVKALMMPVRSRVEGAQCSTIQEAIDKAEYEHDIWVRNRSADPMQKQLNEILEALHTYKKQPKANAVSSIQGTDETFMPLHQYHLQNQYPQVNSVTGQAIPNPNLPTVQQNAAQAPQTASASASQPTATGSANDMGMFEMVKANLDHSKGITSDLVKTIGHISGPRQAENSQYNSQHKGNHSYNKNKSFYSGQKSSKPNTDRACYNCGETGHFKRDCPKLKSSQRVCHHCDMNNHWEKDCVWKSKGVACPRCTLCNRKGHNADRCQRKTSTNL